MFSKYANDDVAQLVTATTSSRCQCLLLHMLKSCCLCVFYCATSCVFLSSLQFIHFSGMQWWSMNFFTWTNTEDISISLTEHAFEKSAVVHLKEYHLMLCHCIFQMQIIKRERLLAFCDYGKWYSVPLFYQTDNPYSCSSINYPFWTMIKELLLIIKLLITSILWEL